MEYPDVHEIKAEIEPKIRKGLVTSRILLGRSRFIDESSLKSSAFNDPAHFPFYYHFAKVTEAASLVEIGVGLGLRAASFAQGTDLERFNGLQRREGDEFYGVRLAVGNIRDHVKKSAEINVHHGLITDKKFTTPLIYDGWDVAMVSEEADYDRQMENLNAVWSDLVNGGYVLVDYQNRHEPTRRAFEDFCKIQNRDPVTVKTRYGVGIVQR